MKEFFGRLGMWPVRFHAPEDESFATPFEHPFYRYERQIDDIVTLRAQLKKLDNLGRNGFRLSPNEQMSRKRFLAAIDARLRFISGTVKKRGDE